MFMSGGTRILTWSGSRDHSLLFPVPLLKFTQLVREGPGLESYFLDSALSTPEVAPKPRGQTQGHACSVQILGASQRICFSRYENHKWDR